MIGSGLNPKKVEPQPVQKPPAAAPAPPPQPAAQKPQPPPVAAKPEERKEQHQAPADQAKKAAAGPDTPHPASGPGKYCVQVASSQDRKDAEVIKGRMAEKGLTAYIVDSNIKDKGTWYRVRIGKHLTQQAAGELAGEGGQRGAGHSRVKRNYEL